MASPLAQQMQAIVAHVVPLMKASSFRKQRHTFNRPTTDGLVHVVHFQMGSYEPIPPNLSEPDRIRYLEQRTQVLGSSLYGAFTVNLGVFIPEMDEVTRGMSTAVWPPKTFHSEAECQIRGRLGDLIAPEDTWWDLGPPASETGQLMARLFEEFALPFLDRFPNREAIWALWNAAAEAGRPTYWRGADVPFDRPARLILAVMAAHRGDGVTARRLLQEHYTETIIEARVPRHATYVEELASHLQLEPLTRPIG